LFVNEKRAFHLPTWVRGAVIGILLGWMGSHLFPPINLDVGCLLYAAKRWISGDRLYVDVIDPNTPWAIGLHVPAEFTAEHLGLDGPTWFSVYVVLSVLISVGLVAVLTKRYASFFGPLVAPTLPLLALFVLGVDPNRCFGQREHLLMVAVTPYLVLSALRAEGRAEGATVSRGLRIPIALIAGLGFTIKPHFLLPLTLVELYLLVNRGWKESVRDLVPWTILAVQVAHLLFAVLVTPEYLEVIVPFASEVYTTPASMVSRALEILFGPDLGPVLVLLPLLGSVAVMARLTLARLLALFALGSATIAALQGKGWDYHALPAIEATLLLTGVVIAHLVERHVAGLSASRDSALGLSTVLLLPFLLLDGLRLAPFRDQVQYSKGPVDDWVDVMEQEPGNHRVLLLSAGMYPQFPAINYADFEIATPFMTLWPLMGSYEACAPGEKGYRPLGKQSEEEAYVFEEVVEGLVEERPEIVVVDEADGMRDCSKQPFEYLDYFMRDGRFAREFQNYRPLKTVDHFVFYERHAAVAPAPPPPIPGQPTPVRPNPPASLL
jgi:hypothetical protein